MGRHYFFKPGSFYRVDDRTGFPQRAERTRKQWNNLIVDESVWESRQPQDLVKGVKDQQSVQDARPLSPAQFVGPIYTQLTATVAIGSIDIPVNSTAGLVVGDPFGVVLDTDGGIYFVTYIIEIDAGLVIIAAPLPGQASSGNLAVDYTPGVPSPNRNAFPDLDFSIASNSMYLGIV